MNPGRNPETSLPGGQALVEFALVLPITALLLLGILGFGRVYILGTSVQQGAGQAARLASVQFTNPGLAVTNTKIYQRLIDASAPALSGCAAGSTSSMTCTDVRGGTWTLSITYSPAQAAGNSVEVKAVGIVPLTIGLVGGGWGISQVTLMGDAASVIL